MKDTHFIVASSWDLSQMHFSSRHAEIPNGLARSGKIPETSLPELGEIIRLQMQARGGVNSGAKCA